MGGGVGVGVFHNCQGELFVELGPQKKRIACFIAGCDPRTFFYSGGVPPGLSGGEGEGSG